ncbi:Peptide synthetase [Candidatus Paraburkholderia calva]|nr:Peptide synthetase [Candidatus Paraburkholderia calva]
MRMDALPVSGSGKIDRRTLPAPVAQSVGEPPHPGLEAKIAAVWCALLKIERIGRDDDFFHLGGNSILAMRMHARVRAETGLEFALPAFYRAPSRIPPHRSMHSTRHCLRCRPGARRRFAA